MIACIPIVGGNMYLIAQLEGDTVTDKIIVCTSEFLLI